MKKQRHYTAAIMGQGGIYSALKTAFCSRFSSIRAFVMIPSKSEKLELTVTRDARSDSDHVTLMRRNWRTGEESQLYNGKLTGGIPLTKRLPREG